MILINISDTDLILRVIVGLALIGLAMAGMIGLWGYIGIVPLVTALLGFCPTYSLLGINTSNTK
jgi:hypothetical protein